MTEFQLMLFLIGVHIFGFVAVGLLMLPVLRDDPSEPDEDGGSSDDGWGNRPNVKPDPSRWPGGGIPLPDAEQSSVRLREPGRLADKITHPERRPAREPVPSRPVRAND
jgi:hypothetical protein